MDEPTELENLKLGDLYQRACNALLRVPEKELTEVFNSDDPKQALIQLIVGSTVSTSTCIPATATAESKLATDTGLDAEPPRVFELVVEDGVMHLGALQSVGVEDSLRMKQKLDTIWRNAEAPWLGEVWQWLYAIAKMSLLGGGAWYIHNAQEQLRQILELKGQQAVQRQADRQAERALPGSRFESIVKKKLAMPAVSLLPTESRNCLVSCIEHGKVQAKHAEGKKVVVVLGNTGAGKSAFINLLHGCTFGLDSEDNIVVRSDSPMKELMKIGHTNKSETFAPQVEEVAASFGEGYAVADCPGFLDNRGFEINVANAVNVKQTTVAAASVIVVVIINYHSLLADRGKGVKDLFHILSGFFGTIENVKKHANSLLLVISQAPATHPETGQGMTLARCTGKLLDPSGLDETGKDLLSAIGDANVLIYHLLERGDESWLKQDAIIARIKGLVPITEPGRLFQSAINDADKESLRDLVSDLGKQLKSAISSAEYVAAADVVSDLLELKLVEHSFVTTIVDEAVSDAIDDSMVTVRAIVNGRGEPGCKDDNGDENAPMVDAHKFEDARRELRNLSSVLAAFAGIVEVREKLRALLIEATCQLESLVKQAAEDAGQKEVEESLREVLRIVGDNVVREVLELPKAAAAMKAKHREERMSLEELQAEEMSRLPEHAPTEQVDMAKERHAIQLQEASYRVEAANEVWQGHLDHAGTKLEQRDESLLAEEGAAFWTKVGWSSSELCTRAIPEDWARMRLLHRGQYFGGQKLTKSDCEVMATVFRKLAGTPSLEGLFLSSCAIGDSGITALSDATAFGALASLKTLCINDNKIGDTGMVELSGAMANGRLENLIFLDLNGNHFGDPGMTAFASAIANGAMQNLGTLYLYSNMIGDAGTTAFADSLSSSGALAKLEKLWLYSNKIGDLGMKALSDGIAIGGLASLKSLQLEGNPAKNEVQQATLETLKKRRRMP
ncbi:unnamed protein product [Polarella glacialis]|uniref:G domain-containing protein n=1 Tax=Polarella glacialis TaxID=89957 RepID=A0A813HZB6_POLGL|nr:unnamed protein product [Polarella glacialis]CAE8710920.1 unnamed protein product [Polarella glacialis]